MGGGGSFKPKKPSVRGGGVGEYEFFFTNHALKRGIE